MKDFFISYNKADQSWAEWIAWSLEENDYSIVIQAWDSQYGEDFVQWMHKAIKESDRTIAVLSPSYLESGARFSQMERNAALYADKLLPIRVQNVEDMGLLGPIAYIDLVGLGEDQAREKLLRDIKYERKKPGTAPVFSGSTKHTVVKPNRFPGALPPIWKVPHNRNPNFTGRENLLSAFRNSLNSEQSPLSILTLHGLGGIGKTQLALEYTYRYANEYDIVWWIRAEDTTTLAVDYVGLASELKLPEKDAKDQSVVIAAVRRWLDQNQGWLLVFDNAKHVENIQSYLPQGKSGHVLITSRNPNWEDDAILFNLI